MNPAATWARPALLPFSWVYRAGVALRNQAFESGLLSVTRIGVPVISVGNIVAGGVGKTPLVRHIAECCTRKGWKVGVVSRGYKRRTTGVVEVSRGQGPMVGPDLAGDEAVQIASSLPELFVVVAEKRVEAALRAVALGAEVVIADDGYQHRYLGRDLNILVLDARSDLTREWLLPAGALREPLASVPRADVVAFSHADGDEAPAWAEMLPGLGGTPLVGFRFRPLPPRDGLRGETVGGDPIHTGKVLAFSGIGNHKRFIETLRTAGYAVGADLRFPDHHTYSGEDLRRIGALMMESGCGCCVTTEKDMARIDRKSPEAVAFLKERNVLYIPVAIEFTRGESLFHRKIDECLNKQSQRE